jgi:chromosome segregation ATPase
MSVLDDIANVTARIEKVEQLRKLSLTVGSLNERCRELQGHQHSLAVHLDKAEAMCAEKAMDVNTLESAEKQKEALAQVTEQAAADPTKITDGRRYKNLLTGLTELEKSLEQAIATSWDSYTQLKSRVDSGFLDLVESVRVHKKEVEAIRKMLGDLERRKEAGPQSLSDVQAFKTLRDSYEKAHAALDPEGWPQSVRDFLRQARGEGGASHEALSDEVKKWLTDKGLLGSVRLVLRSPNN